MSQYRDDFKTVKELVQEFGFNRKQISKVLTDALGSLRSGAAAHGISKKLELLVLARYKEVENSQKVGAEFGVTSKTVLSIVRRNGGKVHKKGHQSAQRFRPPGYSHDEFKKQRG